MKKMKKSALAAAVLLSLSMMGSAYATVNTPFELKNGEGKIINEDVAIGVSTPISDRNAIYIENASESNPIVLTITPNENGSIKIFTTNNDGELPWHGISAGYKWNDSHKDVMTYAYNTTINLDASLIEINAAGELGEGILMKADGNKLNINQSDYYAKNGVVDIQGSVGNGKQGWGICFYGTEDKDRASALTEFPENASVMRLDGKQITLKGGMRGLDVARWAKAYIGQKNFDAAIRLEGANEVKDSNGLNVTKGEVYLDGRDITMKGCYYSTAVGTNGHLYINQNPQNDKYDKVVLNGSLSVQGQDSVAVVKAKTISISQDNYFDSGAVASIICTTGGTATLEAQTIDVKSGNTKYDQTIQIGKDSTVTVKALKNVDSVITVYKGEEKGWVGVDGTLNIDGNGAVLTWNSGKIDGYNKNGESIVNIFGDVVMHVPSVKNTVNVKENANLTIEDSITFETLNFEKNSTFTVDEANEPEIKVTTDATVDVSSKLVLKNVEAKAYTVLDGVEPDWTADNITTNVLYNVAVDEVTDQKFIVTLEKKEAKDIPSDMPNIIANTGKDTPVGEWINNMAEICIGNDEAFYNAVNTVANMSAVAGVQSGTASMVNSMANNLASNLGSSARPNMIADRGGLRNTASDNGEVKIETVANGKANEVMPTRYAEKAYGKEVWASYIHSKQKIDGLKAGMLDSKSVNQYNGVTVGADLWSGKHSFGGVALSYADGNVNAGNLRNDTDYYGVSIYNRHDYKGLTMLTDVSYTHSKNDINISGVQEITADAKADAIGVGVRFETPVTMGKTTVTPYAGARYTYLKNKDYDNNLGMNYDTDDQNLVTIPVGLEISAEFAMPKSDWTFRPVLEGGYVWNLGDRDGNTKIGYMGAYDIVGFETSDPGQYFIRAAMQFAKADFTCEVGYRYSKGKSVRDNRWNVNLNYAF